MMNLAITGGCGFIGANLVRYLNHLNECRITIIDNLSKGSLSFLEGAGKYRFIEGDIRDSFAINKALKDIDVVIHLAAFGSVVDSVTEPDENFSVNVNGTFNLLKACRDNNIKKVIFASTGGALIGNAEPPVNEQSVPRPISPYGASKLAGEGYCSAFSNSYGMSITALRFANVIGPYSWHKKGAVTAFFKAILDDRPINIFGDGSATRDFLYVDDLCAGIVSALRSRIEGFQVFHLASGHEVSIGELARKVCLISRKKNHPIHFSDKRLGEVDRNFATYNLAQAMLGFEPTYNLDNALGLTWDWMNLNS